MKTKDTIKKIITISILIMFVFNCVFFPLYSAKAVGGNPTDSMAAIQNLISFLGLTKAEEKIEKVKDNLLSATAATIFKTTLQYFLNTMAVKTADSIVNGGRGGKPMFSMDTMKDIMKDAADNAAGKFIEELTKDTGLDLCNPNFNFKFKLMLGLQDIGAPAKPKCSLTKLSKNWKTALDKLKDPNFLNNFQDYFNPFGNETSMALSLQTGIMEEIEVGKANQALEQQKQNDVQGTKETITGRTKTPAEVNRAFLIQPILDATKICQGYTGQEHLLSQAFCLFSQSLWNKLMIKWMLEGMASLAKKNTESINISEEGGECSKQGGPCETDDNCCSGLTCDGVMCTGTATFGDLTDSSSSSANYEVNSLETGPLALGVVTTTIGGSLPDVLSELATCEDENNPSYNHCVITDKFKDAVNKNLTLQQAINQNLINKDLNFGWPSETLKTSNRNNSYPYRSLIIMRKHRLVPVGWEIASWVSEQRQEHVSLKYLVENYNTQGSPYYHLVDPTWILKSPKEYCSKMGPGPDIVSQEETPAAEEKLDGFFKDESIANFDTQSDRDLLEGYIARKMKVALSLKDALSNLNLNSLAKINWDTLTTVSSGLPASEVVKQHAAGKCLFTDPCCESKESDCSSGDTSVAETTCAQELNKTIGEWCIWAAWGTCCKAQMTGPSSSMTNIESSYQKTLSLYNIIKTANSSYEVYSDKFSQYKTNNAGTTNPLYIETELLDLKMASETIPDFKKVLNRSTLFDDVVLNRLTAFLNSYTELIEAFRTDQKNVSEDYVSEICLASGEKTSVCKSIKDINKNYNSELAVSSQELEIKINAFSDKLTTIKAAGEKKLTELPPSLQITRGSYCADEQSCIYENEKGDCLMYGYCFAEKRVNRFGESCDQQYNTCMTFKNSQGQAIAYLRNTLHFGNFNNYTSGCNADNAGCRKYSGPRTYYLTQEARACTKENVGCLPYKVYGEDLQATDQVVYLKSFATQNAIPGCHRYSPSNGELSIPGRTISTDICPASCNGYKEYIQGRTYIQNDTEKFRLPFIASTAQTCSANDVGCEEFTNLDVSAQGGEGNEYYTYIRQCSKPSEASCNTFYTWEGSDTAGFQLKTYYLVQDQTTQGPELVAGADTSLCNEQKANLLPTQTGYDPNCKTYYNTSGQRFYAYYPQTKTCSDDCHPLRLTLSAYNQYPNQSDQIALCQKAGGVWNSQQGCIFNAIPSEGVTCSASAVGCRAYKGATADNYQIILNDNFDNGTNNSWTNAIVSSETPLAKGSSITNFSNGAATSYILKELASQCTLPSPCTFDTCVCSVNSHVVCSVTNGKSSCFYGAYSNNIRKGSAYIISFWAKSLDTNGSSLFAKFSGGSNAGLFTPTGVNIDNSWRSYTFGPVVITWDISGPESLVFDSISRQVYLDNIILKEVKDNLYLVKNSWTTPAECDQPYTASMLNCQEYTDENGEMIYLKSIDQICSENDIGAVYVEKYHQCSLDTKGTTCQVQSGCVCTSNSGDGKTCTVAYGSSECIYPESAEKNLLSVKYSASDQCPSNQAECAAYQEYIDPGDNSKTANAYLAYQSEKDVLCDQSAEFCDKYTGADGATYYFQYPGSNVCEFKLNPNSTTITVPSWWKVKTKSTDADESCCLSGQGIDCQIDSRFYAASCPPSQSGCSKYTEYVEGSIPARVYSKTTDGDAVYNERVHYAKEDSLEKKDCTGLTNTDMTKGCIKVLADNWCQYGGSVSCPSSYPLKNIKQADTVVSTVPDRVCDKWYYCDKYTDVTMPGGLEGTKEKLCTSIGVCGGIDITLSNQTGMPVCTNPITNYTTNTFDFSSGSIDGDILNVFKNLTGYIKPTFTYSTAKYQGVPPLISSSFSKEKLTAATEDSNYKTMVLVDQKTSLTHHPMCRIFPSASRTIYYGYKWQWLLYPDTLTDAGKATNSVSISKQEQLRECQYVVDNEAQCHDLNCCYGYMCCQYKNVNNKLVYSCSTPANQSPKSVNVKKGYYGYCLETDPANPDVCLWWYPDWCMSTRTGTTAEGSTANFCLNCLWQTNPTDPNSTACQEENDVPLSAACPMSYWKGDRNESDFNKATNDSPYLICPSQATALPTNAQPLPLRD